MTVAAVLGLFAGVFSGLVPAAGNLSTLLILMPVLSVMSADELLLFYIIMASVSQYITAIPSILLSFPGESSSIYTVKESAGFALPEKQKILRESSIYSFVFTICTVFLLYAVSDILVEYVANLFRSSIIFSILLIAFITTVLFSQQNRLVSFLLLCLGFTMSFVGYNFFFGTNVTFGLNFLVGGFDPVLITVLFVGISEIFKPALLTDNTQEKILTSNRSSNIVNLLTSSVIGFIGGLIPGLTTVTSSSLYYSIGKLIRIPKNKLIVGIENANNIGAISQILPLLFFGIPILASEALLLALMNSKGFTIFSFDMSNFFKSAATFFIITNLTALAICLLFTKLPVQNISVDLLKRITLALMLTSLGAYILLDNVITNVLQLLLLVPLAYILRQVNSIPLVLGFLLAPLFFESASRLFNF